jgi:hypothetical protein
MGRTPVIATTIREFLPWNQILNYLEAVVRVYNRWGRRDNLYKARIKILVKAEGQRYIDEVEAEYRRSSTMDAPHTITQAELRPRGGVVRAARRSLQPQDGDAKIAHILRAPPRTTWNSAAGCTRTWPRTRTPTCAPSRCRSSAWVRPRRRHGRPAGQAPTWPTSSAPAKPASRTTRTWCCPGCAATPCPSCGAPRARPALPAPTSGLLTDMIACPGGDFCSLANARSLPIAEAITERYQDLDELHDLGEIDLHISGCINSCGHHHSGHIGILGVDKDGKEWYQITLGGSDGSALSGAPVAGKVVGPSFSCSRGARRDRSPARHLPRAPRVPAATRQRPSSTRCAGSVRPVQGRRQWPRASHTADTLTRPPATARRLTMKLMQLIRYQPDTPAPRQRCCNWPTTPTRCTVWRSTAWSASTCTSPNSPTAAPSARLSCCAAGSVYRRDPRHRRRAGRPAGADAAQRFRQRRAARRPGPAWHSASSAASPASTRAMRCTPRPISAKAA